MFTKKNLLFTLICIFIVTSIQAQTLYVKSGATGSGDGSTWENAYTSLAPAIQYAIDNAGNVTQIWVAGGSESAPAIFYPENRISATTGTLTDRDKTFFIPSNIQIYGGFNPALTGTSGNANNTTDRNPKIYVTILNGDLDKNGTSNDNDAYHVITIINNNNIKIDGFTITGGRANTGTTITVGGITGIERNAGAGVYTNTASNIILNNLTIKNNISTSVGAGLYLNKGTGIESSNLIVTGNTASSTGGGMLIAASVSMTNSIIFSNSAGTSYGGGISFNDYVGYSRCSLKNVLMYSNTGGSNGSELYFGGYNYGLNDSRFYIDFQNVTVVSNSGYRAFMAGSNFELTLYNSIITSRSASGYCGYSNGSYIINNYNSYMQYTSSMFNKPDINLEVDAIPETTDPNLFFVNLSGGNFHLTECSPVVNRGNNDYVNNTTDLDGNPRIVNNNVDLGVYEYQGTTPNDYILMYNNPADPGEELLKQTISNGSPIQDVLFYYAGGALSVEASGLPDGVNLVVAEEPDQEGHTTFKITGIPTLAGSYNYEISTTVDTANHCYSTKSIHGNITVIPLVNPDTNGVVYVWKGKTGDGSSWENALGELADGLLAAKYNSDVKQLWVGEGTYSPEYKILDNIYEKNAYYDYSCYCYKETYLLAGETTFRDKSFVVTNGVKLFGGFKPDDGIRDLTHKRDSSVCILSGAITNEDGDPDNVYHVVVATNYSGDPNAEIIIDGFTITGGKADGISTLNVLTEDGSDNLLYAVPQNAGAGVYVAVTSGTATISYCNIKGNIAGSNDNYISGAGGGIYALKNGNAMISISNNDITENNADGSYSEGGGIAAISVGSSSSSQYERVNKNLVSGNGLMAAQDIESSESDDSESLSAGIYIFRNNIAQNNVLGNYTRGGGISARASGTGGGSQNQRLTSSIITGNVINIYENSITGNSATGRSTIGGGIAASTSSSGNTPSLTSTSGGSDGGINIYWNDIENNTTSGIYAGGGGIATGDYMQQEANRVSSFAQKTTQLRSSSFIGNTGGVSISYNKINENSASGDYFVMGGGLYTGDNINTLVINNLFTNNTSAVYGGGIFSSYGTSVINNTITGNAASVQGGGLAGNFDHIYNSIIWGNTAPSAEDVYLGYNYEAILNSLIGSFIIDDGIIPADGDEYNNIVGTGKDPQFTNPASGDYSLQTGSLAQDAGNNSAYARFGDLTADTDLAKSYRKFGPNIDMGAYETNYGCPELGDGNGRVYVTVTGGVSTTDGSSWDNAYTGLAGILKTAGDYPGCITEIWVAEGTYYPEYKIADLDRNGNETSDRDKSFVLVPNVKVYGGFASGLTGTEGDIDQRDWKTNASILSGDLGVAEDPSDNAYHVVVASGDLGTAVLDGFTITEGNADKESSVGGFYALQGGGITFDKVAAPVLSNLIITKNNALLGGGIGFFLQEGDETDDFINGGNYGSPIVIRNVEISENTSLYLGAGMFNMGRTFDIYNFDIRDNELDPGEGDTGGGILSVGTLNLTNGKITGNKAPRGGGFTFVQDVIPDAGFTMTNVTISGNETFGSELGGGILLIGTGNGQNQTINNSIIWGNTADGQISNVVNMDGSDINIVFSYSIIQESGGSSNWDDYFGVDGGNNLDADPMFTATGDYTLQTGSPAVDSGNNSLYSDAGGSLASDKDIAGNPRVAGGTIDRGAYESLSNVLTLGIRLFLQGPTKSDGKGGAVMNNYIQTGGYAFTGTPKLPVQNPYGIKNSSSEVVEYADINNVSGAAGTVVDWVRVEIWQLNTELTKKTLLETKALLLKPDGSVVDLDGSIPSFTPQAAGVNVNVVVKHRNHLAIIGNQIPFVSGSMGYDFSTSLSQAFNKDGRTNQMILKNTVWCLRAGDLTMDNIVDSADRNKFNPPFNLTTKGQYIPADLNMDGIVDSADRNLFNPAFNGTYYSTIIFY